ncbi:MAG TPA: VTT domain-containing protein [Vicinamibacterales bacterium]|nr:VTT domain-containing protein [Vicinamibacterales bacterium]
MMRSFLVVLWLALVGGAIYAFVFHRDLIRDELGGAMSVSAVAGGAVYLLLGAIRGFTLIPSTTLVLAAVAFFPPAPLFALTLAGIVISSACIYWFAESIGIDEVLKRRHPAAIARLTELLEKHELPIIIGWSFFPLAPTDLICYVCGVLRVNFLTCLIGVAIGEGTICGIYIFVGDKLLHWLTLK